MGTKSSKETEMSTTRLSLDWMRVDKGAMDATLDVSEKMPHAVFVSVFDEKWLTSDRPVK